MVGIELFTLLASLSTLLGLLLCQTLCRFETDMRLTATAGESHLLLPFLEALAPLRRNLAETVWAADARLEAFILLLVGRHRHSTGMALIIGALF